MLRRSDYLVIDLNDVAKTYRRKVEALRGIRLEVHPGEIFGLLGPNGAGKSTLVKIMMTVVRPTRAEGTVLGRPMGHKPTLAKVGYLPEHHRFPPYLTGAQALEYYAALAKLDRRTRKRRTAELLELVGLKDKAKTKVGTYSKGMQQRIGIAQALMHEPELVVLDEPTDGLDPMGRREVRKLLNQLRDEGKTIFINSHLLGEVELVCDRVAILNAGKVVRQGTIDELTADNMFHEIELEAPPDDTLRRKVAEVLRAGIKLTVEDNLLRINTRDPQAVQPVIDAIRRQDITILSVRPVRQSLEDFFISAVSAPAAEEPIMARIVKERIVTQTGAIFIEAYRNLNSKKLFWISLVISGLVVGAFSLMGINEDGIKIAIWQLDNPFGINSNIIAPGEFYKALFVHFGIGFWLSWIATILALVSTGGIFVDLVTSGSIDLVVSKPIGRLRLFVTQYAAALLFVTLQVTIFTLAAFLVLGFRGGTWEPGLFLAVPVVVCLFSYLYAVCVLLGIVTRSTVAALLLTILFWFAVYLFSTAEQTILLFDTMQKEGVTLEELDAHQKGRKPIEDGPDDNADKPSDDGIHWLSRTHDIVYGIKTVLPKTDETIGLLERWLMDVANLQERPDDDRLESMKKVEKELVEELHGRSVAWIVGTSLGFELVVLALAAWVFCRRDY